MGTEQQVVAETVTSILDDVRESRNESVTVEIVGTADGQKSLGKQTKREHGVDRSWWGESIPITGEHGQYRICPRYDELSAQLCSHRAASYEFWADQASNEFRSKRNGLIFTVSRIKYRAAERTRNESPDGSVLHSTDHANT